MDKAEATTIAESRLRELRNQPHERLISDLLDQPRREEITGNSGRVCQVETRSMWDDRRRRHVRVVVAIDDGGLPALVPLTRSFIIAPDGSFIGG